MFKLFFSLLLLVTSINAASFTYPDFKQCYAKNVKSFVYFGDIRAVAVSKHLAVAYSKTKPNVKFEKYDPFLNLYLFYSKKTLMPVKFKNTSKLKIGEWIAGMDDNSLYIGNFSANDDMISSIYLQNSNLKPNSMVTCLCCDIYGLGIGSGKFIDSELIKRFINTKSKIQYGDIGVEFVKRGNDIFVDKVNPFYKNNPLKKGCKIVSVNGKKINSLKQLTRAILFAKPNSKLKIRYLNGKELIESEVKVYDRLLGDKKSNSFLEKAGVYIDDKLKITKITKDSKAFDVGLKVGDKFLMVNKKDIKSKKDLKEFLSNTKDKELEFLIDRNDFQFFVKLRI
ncbi:PDZ domain-containing protein [Sulfurospirillum sp. 1307]|jgi:hypothetical protein